MTPDGTGRLPGRDRAPLAPWLTINARLAGPPPGTLSYNSFGVALEPRLVGPLSPPPLGRSSSFVPGASNS